MIKLMVMGHGRHGKDTVCQILKDVYKFNFKSSSEIACELFIYPLLRDTEGYSTIEECFNDRHNKREQWFELIKAFSADDKTRLTRRIFDEYDIYCGIRNHEELHAARAAGLFDCAIWVDASHRLPAEDASSCTVTPADADFVVDNNGSLIDLQQNIARLMHKLFAVVAARDEASAKKVMA